MTDEEAQRAEPTTPADDADDTEGHSLQLAEFSRTMARDRVREGEQAAREARMREDGKPKQQGRSLFRR